MLNFSRESKALNFRKPKLFASYNESVAARKGVEFLKFSKKRGGSDFFHKNRGVGKIGGVVLKRGRYHLFPY